MEKSSIYDWSESLFANTSTCASFASMRTGKSRFKSRFLDSRTVGVIFDDVFAFEYVGFYT